MAEVKHLKLDVMFDVVSWIIWDFHL